MAFSDFKNIVDVVNDYQTIETVCKAGRYLGKR
jgi:hypothetical protein